jgi:hypothetical protein
MTYHKIRGVDKSVCTAEQKIAYNLAFHAHISFQNNYDKARSVSAACVSALVGEIVALSLKNYRSAYDYKPGKYDEDAIFCALNAGISAYLERPFIASDYATIGKAFPAHYLNA